jgi:prepilin-type N-terminal cleavage/methylation domain-containing protein
MKRVRGFTFIELLITIALGAGFLIWSVSLSDVYGRAMTAKRLDEDAQLLLESMNQYYHRHCTEAVFPAITEAQLRGEGILNGGGFNNPWGGNYQLVIDRIRPGNPQLRVSVVFNNAVDAGYVAGLSENSSVAGTTVTWTSNSTLSRSADGIRKQLDREAFGSPMC